MHWFLQEQREEVSSMSALLDVVSRSKDNVMHVEDFLARESGGENPLEAGAPPAAGGALSSCADTERPYRAAEPARRHHATGSGCRRRRGRIGGPRLRAAHD